jgi:hypothetical protein
MRRNMNAKEALYLAPEVLYRIGSSTSPLLNRVRPDEIDVLDLNGVKVIVANGRGLSLYNKGGLDRAPLSGWAWEIPANTPLPAGLRLLRDESPEGHYTLCPANNMSVHEFVATVEQLVIHCRKAFKKRA